MMKNRCFHLPILLVLIALICSDTLFAKQKKVLVFSKTAGYRHTSAIAAGKKAFLQLGSMHQFEVDTTEKAEVFAPENLKQYSAIVFLCTTGDVLNEEQQVAFQQFIKAGGGFVGLHSAADTEYDWPWFGELNGAYFKSHPKQQEAAFHIVDTNHIATAHLPKVWKRFDELYNFKWIGLDLHFLITIDEDSYAGGENGEFHPMSWYHDVDGGRAFYTALGHDSKSFNDPLYIQHILGGLQYAMGERPEAKNVKSK